MAKKPDTACGVIVIDKHEGVTSFRIISILKKMFDMPNVGHTGTLDPLATGVLPVLLGRAVKACDYIMAQDKRYTAEL
ncbi:MAG: tRNA pseudouridine(55) synthase, partial [Clostridia bacterium]|nr:tRNA pseudouridine(55) synthase [Clostridia bacterium]